MGVRQDFEYAVAQSSVEYEIKDPHVAKLLEVNVKAFKDTSCTSLWTDKSYQLSEWNIYRETDVNKNVVLKNFRSIDFVK